MLVAKTDEIQLPNINLPDGYIVRFGRMEYSGRLHREDRKIWIRLHKTGTTFHGDEEVSMAWYFSNAPIPLKSRYYVFAEYKSQVVGSMCILPPIIKEKVLIGNAVVLEKHRRKGLYKAMNVLCIQRCLKEKIELVYTSPRHFTTPFFLRWGFKLAKMLFKDENTLTKYLDKGEINE